MYLIPYIQATMAFKYPFYNSILSWMEFFEFNFKLEAGKQKGGWQGKFNAEINFLRRESYATGIQQNTPMYICQSARNSSYLLKRTYLSRQASAAQTTYILRIRMAPS